MRGLDSGYGEKIDILSRSIKLINLRLRILLFLTFCNTLFLLYWEVASWLNFGEV